MLLPAMLASWTIFHTRYGASFATGYLQAGEKMRKAPILFHYTNLAEGMTERRLETDIYVPLA
ncbi:putative regulatory protein [Escherichia coli]|uniref:Putative regulatory protein n=1 Tax=Escherichia coli TaxID=562 RepID=A0A484YRD9_ECOLX|nr:putative regulatory protein [Escherichia coli]